MEHAITRPNSQVCKCRRNARISDFVERLLAEERTEFRPMVRCLEIDDFFGCSRDESNDD